MNMIKWVQANCRFASADIGERAAQAMVTAFAKAFKKVSAGRKVKIAANGDIAGDAQKQENLISIAMDYLQTDPELAPTWQGMVNRAKALKSGGQVAQQDLVGLLQPFDGAIAKVSGLYGISPDVLKKKLVYVLGLDQKRPSPFAPGFVPQKQPIPQV